MERISFAPGAFVTEVPGEKFKRSLAAVHLVLKSERDTATALAVLPHVLERRCAAIPDPIELSRRLFDLYGAELSVESYTAGACRVLTMAVSGLKNEYALAGEDLAGQYLDLLGNLLFAPKLAGEAFEAVDVEIETEKQADYLRSEMNEKRSYCLHQARRRLYGDTLLGIEAAGYLEELPAVTGESLYTAWRDLLAKAQIEVMVCGIEQEKAAGVMRGWLDGVDRAPEALPARTVVPGGAAFFTEEEAMDTSQGKLNIICTGGSVTDAKGEAVMRVANALLGGLPTSRLFVNVREKQSLCYYCASSYAALKGTLSIDSGVDHENAKRAAEAMLKELRTLQKELVSEEELATAGRAIANAFSTGKDSPDALANWAFNEQLRGTALTLDEAAALVGQVTREEVRDALASFEPAIEYVITKKGGAEA